MRELDFTSGTVLGPAYLDARQELTSGLAVNVRLEKQSATSVRVTAANDGNGQAGLVIGGKARWNTATKTLTISGVAGTYSIFAVVDSESPVEVNDPASRGFSLEQNAGTPSATYRKIGEVDWDGSAITDLRNMVGGAPTHSPALTGVPTVPTQATADDSKQAVNSEWVRDQKYMPSIVIPHTWSFTGAATTSDLLPGMFVPVPAGRYAKLLSVVSIALGGGTGTFKITGNGADLTGFTGLGVSGATAVADPTDVALTHNAYLRPVLTAASSLSGLTITAFVEYGVL